MPDSALLVEHITKRFSGHDAVRDLSLSVPRGTVYGLLGPNGAGKTTTIRMVLDILAPDEGRILILGRANTDDAVRQRVGYLPEERGLYKKMQVRRMLRFLAELKGVPGREADRRISRWLERFGLIENGRDWGRARVDELSRGMQQKVQFIGALLHEPELVILDEPFSGLDPINAQALKDTVVDLRREGRTVVFSTHLMDNAERLCDSICIIARGERQLEGELATVKAQHGGRHVALELASGDAARAVAMLHDASVVRTLDDSNRSFELELAPGADPQALLRRILDAGARVERFEMVRPSLHRIFLDVVGATDVEAGMSGHG